MVWERGWEKINDMSLDLIVIYHGTNYINTLLNKSNVKQHPQIAP